VQCEAANVSTAPDEEKYLQEFFEPMPANHDCGCEEKANPHPDNALQLLEALGAEIAKMPSEDLFDLPVGRVRAAFQNVYDIAAGMLGVDVLAKPMALKGNCSDYPGWKFKSWMYREFGDEKGMMHLLSTDAPFIEAVCWNPRTLNPRNEVPHSALVAWWNSLGKGNPQRSTAAREIEVALASPETQDATFDHIPEHTFDFVADWIEGNRATILGKALRFDVPPALVAGILACEMLYDYSINDKGSDEWGIDLRGTLAAGFASAHYETVVLAREHYDKVSSGPDSPTHEIPWPYWAWYWVALPINIPVYERYFEFREYWEFLMTDAGAITIASLVARWLVDPYLSEEVEKDLIPFARRKRETETLTAEDMAVIFGAYRAGISDWSPLGSIGYASIKDYQTTLTNLGLGDIGKLALPVMKYMLTQFHG